MKNNPTQPTETEAGDPDCIEGECTADTGLQMCIHCGASMFEENGNWFHWSQEDIEYKYRKPQFP